MQNLVVTGAITYTNKQLSPVSSYNSRMPALDDALASVSAEISACQSHLVRQLSQQPTQSAGTQKKRMPAEQLAQPLGSVNIQRLNYQSSNDEESVSKKDVKVGLKNREKRLKSVSHIVLKDVELRRTRQTFW